jgi:hypothetical protein
MASRVACTSGTTRYMFLAEPTGAAVTFEPNWIEHGEPRGVSWTIRKP